MDKYKALMGDMTNSSKHLPTHYALPMGLVLSGKLVVEDFKDRDLGLLIAGFDGMLLAYPWCQQCERVR